jgi:hypothetical protein
VNRFNAEIDRLLRQADELFVLSEIAGYAGGDGAAQTKLEADSAQLVAKAAALDPHRTASAWSVYDVGG